MAVIFKHPKIVATIVSSQYVDNRLKAIPATKQQNYIHYNNKDNLPKRAIAVLIQA